VGISSGLAWPSIAPMTAIEIADFSTRIVSSSWPPRNNSPANETIFRFSRRHPETFAD
jgi:hypothetical protein